MASFTIGGGGFNKLKNIGQIAKQIASRAGPMATTLQRELENAAREIIVRTQGGSDYKGNAFKPYSKGYEARKKERTGKSRPDLTWSGNMLRGIKSKIEQINGGLEGRLYLLPSEADKAYANEKGIFGGKQTSKARHFFHLSKQQLDRLTKRIREAFKL